MNGLANQGLNNHIFDVDFENLNKPGRIAKPELDLAFKQLCHNFLAGQLKDLAKEIKSNHILSLVKALTLVELGIDDCSFNIFSEGSKVNYLGTFRIS